MSEGSPCKLFWKSQCPLISYTLQINTGSPSPQQMRNTTLKGGVEQRAWSEWPLLQDCLLLQPLLACPLAHWVTVPMGLCLGSLLCLGYAFFCGNLDYLCLVSIHLPMWSGLRLLLCCDVTWNASPGCSPGKSNSPHHQIQFTPTPNLLRPSTLGLAAPSTCNPRSHSLPLPPASSISHTFAPFLQARCHDLS